MFNSQRQLRSTPNQPRWVMRYGSVFSVTPGKRCGTTSPFKKLLILFKGSYVQKKSTLKCLYIVINHPIVKNVLKL